MKLPRWLLASFWCLSVLIVLFLAAWWVLAPSRTARHFVAVVTDAKFADANVILSNATWTADKFGYLLLDDGNRKVLLPAKHWTESLRDIELGVFSRPVADILTGRHRLVSQTRFGHFVFTVRAGHVTLDGQVQDSKMKTGWGITAGVPHADPTTVTGTYNCCDADGGEISLDINGERTGIVTAYFGTGQFSFTSEDKTGDRKLNTWIVQMWDSHGTRVAGLQGSF